MFTTALEKPRITAKVVYFGNVIKHLIADELDENILEVKYPKNFKQYMDSQSLLTMPDVALIEVDDDKKFVDQIKYIRQHPFLKDMIIILLGVNQEDFYRKDALALRVNDYYCYPFTMNNIFERINFLLKLKSIKPNAIENLEHIDFKYRIPLVKRIFDMGVAILALVCLMPLFLVVALLIRLESKGPIIYSSKRVGAGYRIFNFYKFRSMRVDADKMLNDLKANNQYGNNPNQKSAFVKFINDPRITKVGNFLRKSSIDELPQLINVLIGDMSLVGNRPLPLYEAELLTTDDWATRFNGPAGLTGLWQTSKRGKTEMSDVERKELDNYYAINYDIFLDFKIMLKTFPAMIQQEKV